MILQHVSASPWVWDETLNPKRTGRRFRITRIPIDDMPMREENVHLDNLGAAVAELAQGEVYAVLVQEEGT